MNTLFPTLNVASPPPHQLNILLSSRHINNNNKRGGRWLFFTTPPLNHLPFQTSRQESGGHRNRFEFWSAETWKYSQSLHIGICRKRLKICAFCPSLKHINWQIWFCQTYVSIQFIILTHVTCCLSRKWPVQRACYCAWYIVNKLFSIEDCYYNTRV